MALCAARRPFEPDPVHTGVGMAAKSAGAKNRVQSPRISDFRFVNLHRAKLEADNACKNNRSWRRGIDCGL